MVIRRETPEEYSQIYDLVKVAFQTAKVTNGKEQDFVNHLRSEIIFRNWLWLLKKTVN